MELNKNIYNLRKNKNFSQEELAEKINVTRQTISNWELGITSPNSEQLILLSKIFKVNVDELIGNNSFNNRIQKNQHILLILFTITAIIWLITFIINLKENNLTTAIIDLSLFIIWSIISILWYHKKIK